MSKDSKEFEQIIARISQKHSVDKLPDLEPFLKIMEKLGNPQQNFKAVHITGTNGKTSTAVYIANLLQLRLNKVGLFISPHLKKVNERISINGVNIPDDEFITIYKNINERVGSEAESFTFFEWLVAIALIYFSQHNVDYAVVEVGIGGLFDETNIVNSQRQVFTPIDLDHTKFLGNTVEEITQEKAGIIKPNSIIFSSPQKTSVRKILSQVADKFDDEIFFVTSENKVHSKVSDNLSKHILGQHQVENINLAIATAESIVGLFKSDEINDLFDNLQIFGRIQVVSHNPEMIVDVAHNPQSVKVLLNTLIENYPNHKKVLVFGAMKDKDIPQMFKLIDGQIDQIYFYQNSSPRSASVEDLKIFAEKNLNSVKVLNLEKIDDFPKVVSDVNQDKKNVIVVTGSFVTVGDFLNYWNQGRTQEV